MAWSADAYWDRCWNVHIWYIKTNRTNRTYNSTMQHVEDERNTVYKPCMSVKYKLWQWQWHVFERSCIKHYRYLPVPYANWRQPWDKQCNSLIGHKVNKDWAFDIMGANNKWSTTRWSCVKSKWKWYFDVATSRNINKLMADKKYVAITNSLWL